MPEELITILSDFFEVGSNCYHYILERVKYAELTAKDFREYNEDDVAEIAEYLVANGVTVQRWIPVTERLPTAEDALKGHVYAFLKDTKSGEEWPYEAVRNHPDWFSHWMPLPEPPKEVE
jgi:hypothetical protein